jgi:hypothetical protein
MSVYCKLYASIVTVLFDRRNLPRIELNVFFKSKLPQFLKDVFVFHFNFDA